MTETIQTAMDRLMTISVEPQDYVAEDGLLYCGSCKTPKEAFFPNGKITAKAFEKARLAARDALAPYAEAYRNHGWQYAAGSSGTAKSLAQISDTNFGLGRITNDSMAKIAEILAREGDANTIEGLGFYDHGETPGLGGEVDNPRWKQQWVGKEVYGDDLSEPGIRLVKGGVDANAADSEHKVDALSGATITSRGVEHLVNYWLGDRGFATYLKKLRQGEV